MIILYFIFVPIIYTFIKLVLYFITAKFGKFSYDGFSAAGFSYDPKNDVFYSTKNAWQRSFGYCHLYDVASPIFRMIIDVERVTFYYNNKNWLITFWKGQYGIVTGAEIGVYATNQKMINKNTLYLPVKDNEMLDMGFILYKRNEELTRIENRHWWLAVFKLGMFSKPRHLSMDIKLTFPNKEMLNAFLKSFRKIGYKDKHYKIENNTFYFTFKRPKTHKVWTRSWILDGITQRLNRKNAKLYDKYLADMIDDNEESINDKKLIMVDDIIPNVVKNNEDKKETKESNTTHNSIYLNPKVDSNIKSDNHE